MEQDHWRLRVDFHQISVHTRFFAMYNDPLLVVPEVDVPLVGGICHFAV